MPGPTLKQELSFRDLLGECIPHDHSRQVTSEHYLERLLRQSNQIRRVMDLGCGAGDSVQYFERKDPSIRWVGLDIEESPEVVSRTRTNAEFHTFDGIHIPFDENRFDLIYCHQVPEHVRHPSDLLQDVHRVLKPNGYLAGSTCQLEPCHSFSMWNYTPYGLRLLIEDANLQLVEIRPGIDALTLIARRGLGRPKYFSRWFARESPLNQVITLLGGVMGKPHASINAMKLLYSGAFCFLARRPHVP